MFRVKLAIVKLTALIGTIFGRGSSLPGLVAQKLKIDLSSNVNFNQAKTIFVLGTNGKTTTANLIYQMLLANNQKVISNTKGANLINGIITLLCKNLKFNKTIDADYILLEVDEKTLKECNRIIKPNVVVITNFFRDQLDRYGEIDLIVDEIKTVLEQDKPKLFLNSLDPYLFYKFLDYKNKEYYGVLSETIKPLDEHKTREIRYCPTCLSPLEYKNHFYSHIGEFYCPKCNNSPQANFNILKTASGFEVNNIHYKGDIPQYLYFNISGALAIINYFNLSLEPIVSVLKNLKPPKGRNEIRSINNHDVYINLVKNVVGFEETIEYVLGKYEQFDVVFCLNDNYADGRDVSWLYDVYLDDFIKQMNKLYCSGKRSYEGALRFSISGFNNTIVEDKISKVLDLATRDLDRALVVIANYTAMSDVMNYFKE